MSRGRGRHQQEAPQIEVAEETRAAFAQEAFAKLQKNLDKKNAK